MEAEGTLRVLKPTLRTALTRPPSRASIVDQTVRQTSGIFGEAPVKFTNIQRIEISGKRDRTLLLSRLKWSLCILLVGCRITSGEKGEIFVCYHSCQYIIYTARQPLGIHGFDHLHLKEPLFCYCCFLHLVFFYISIISKFISNTVSALVKFKRP